MKSIVGKVLRDRYKIVRELRREKFSRVYLAEDRTVAGNPNWEIERFEPQYNNEILGVQSWQNIQKLFVAQATALQRLSQHPHIPQILEFFELDREFYLVREFIDGASLAQRIKQGLLTESEATVWLHDTLTILDFIHQKSLIHLNIRPSSLWQQHQYGTIFLTDFGAVRNSVLALNSQQSLVDSEVINNREFIPPEQQQGSPSFASDIYALGKTIIYALTGSYTKLPDSEFDNAQNLSPEEQAVQPQVNVSSQLTRILNKMVVKLSSERYQSAAEVLADLERQQNVITLPPPFIFDTPPSRSQLKNRAIKSKSKVNNIVLWLLLFLPFLGALITFYIGINKNMYKRFTSYTNENYNFEIKYPLDWRLKELDDPITGEVVVFSSPLESKTDPFIEKIYISVEYLSFDINTLDDYTKVVFEKINREKGNEIEIYEEKKTRLDRYPAIKIVYSRKERDLLLRQMEAFTIKNNRVYIITYTAERAKFSKFLDTAEKMLKSWDIK